MKKLMVFFVIIGSIFIGMNSYGDEFTNSEVTNNQRQDQMSSTIMLGNSEFMTIGFQIQEQSGSGNADVNSMASDSQIQNGTLNESSLTAFGGGIANGGSYRYINQQSAMTIQTDTISGVVGGMGAITQSIGNAISIAGGNLEYGDWNMSNNANSETKPVSINIDGCLNY